MEDRDAWKKQAEDANEKCIKLEILLQGIKSEPDFDKFEHYINNLDSDQISRTYAAIVMNTNLPSSSRAHEGIKINSHQLTEAEIPKQIIDPNIELIRLMKKEKLSNKIL
jgi:hypothetical protein